MNEPKGLIDYYNYYDISYDASIEEIKQILDYEFKNALSSNDKTEVQKAALYLLNPKTKESYDSYLKRHKFDENVRKMEQKKKRVFKIVKKAVLIGTLVAIGLTAHNYKEVREQENLDNNVCVEYRVQEGDSYNYLEDTFEDYSIVEYEVTGPYRDENKVYKDDVVIGRTTEEKAVKLQENGSLRIISVDEAVERLEEDGNLKGEFKAYVNGDSDVAFYEPTNQKIV